MDFRPSTARRRGQKLNLGLIGRVLGTTEPEKLLKVKALHLSDLNIATIGDLEVLASVQEVHLQRNSLTNIDGLAVLKDLVVLSLKGNKLANDVSFALFPHLRVLDVSDNNDLQTLRLPESLTVLDIRGTKVESFPKNLIDLNGERVVKKTTLKVPLLGDKPNEARRQTVTLEFSKDDDLKRIAEDFCDQYDVSQKDAAVSDLVEHMASCFQQRRPAVDYETTDDVVDATFQALTTFPDELDGTATAARSRAAAALQAKRLASRQRRDLLHQAPSYDAANLRNHDLLLAQRRRDFASSVRQRLNHRYGAEALSSVSSPPAQRDVTTNPNNFDSLVVEDFDDDDWDDDDDDNDINWAKFDPPTLHDDIDVPIYGDDDDPAVVAASETVEVQEVVATGGTDVEP